MPGSSFPTASPTLRDRKKIVPVRGRGISLNTPEHSAEQNHAPATPAESLARGGHLKVTLKAPQLEMIRFSRFSGAKQSQASQDFCAFLFMRHANA